MIDVDSATLNDYMCMLQLITFQRKRANRRVINEAELLDLLQTYAPVQVVEFNSSHSFAEQLTTISQTGVFVSVSPSFDAAWCITCLPIDTIAGIWHTLWGTVAGSHKQFGQCHLSSTGGSSR